MHLYTVSRRRRIFARGRLLVGLARREREGEARDGDDLRPFNEMRSRGSLGIRRGIGKNRGFVTCRECEGTKGEELRSFSKRSVPPNFPPIARAKFEERDERIVSQSLQTFLFPYRRTPLRLDHLLGHEIRKGMKQTRRKMGGGKEGWRE